MEWNFNAADYKEISFEAIPVGDYRVRIEDAQETKSKSDNDMIKVTLSISGKNSKLFHNITFLTDNPQMTNQKLGEFWESFGIQMGNLNIATWKGKVGACRVKHEMYNGENQAKVSYFRNRKEQEKLPAWVEPGNGNGNSNTAVAVNNVPFDTSDLPL